MNAQNEIARYLQLERGAATLKVTRVFHTQNEGAIICTIGYYRPDEFAYYAEHISVLGDTVDLLEQ